MQALVNIYVYIFVLALSAVVVVYAVVGYWRKRFAGVKRVEKKKDKRPVVHEEGGEAARTARGGGAVTARERLRNRMNARRGEGAADQAEAQQLAVYRAQEREAEVAHSSASDAEDAGTTSAKKIGVKKQRKLDEKKARKEEREIMEREREERKKQEAKQEKEKKEREALEAKAEAERQEQLRIQREEEERREAEEYARMKAEFSIEDEGEDAVKINEQFETDFVEHVKRHKVVMVEELASAFRLKTKECVDLLQSHVASGRLSGVLDDRGKFIFITPQEYDAVARFIRQRGRVTIKELAENSNRLIRLGEAQFQASSA